MRRTRIGIVAVVAAIGCAWGGPAGPAPTLAGEAQAGKAEAGVWKPRPGDPGRFPYFRLLAVGSGKGLLWSTECDLLTGQGRKLVAAVPDKIVHYNRHGRWRPARVEGELIPSRTHYFNQAAYVPSRRKAYFFVAGRLHAFDLPAKRWSEVKAPGGPPLVVWGAMEYDPVNEELVLFGGGAGPDGRRPGTWLFNLKSGKWSRPPQPIEAQPPARCMAAMAYDSRNKLIAVFGGNAQDRYLTDTWVYDCPKRQWRELKANVRPWPRKRPCLTYLGKHGVFLMGGTVVGEYGKYNSADYRVGQPYRAKMARAGRETWVLDAAKATWTRVRGDFPVSRVWTSLTYDGDSDTAVVYRVPRDGKAKAGLHAWRPDLTPAAEPGTPAPANDMYVYYRPEWYTRGLPPADAKAGEAFLAKMPPNRWVEVKPPRPAHTRTWGSAIMDTDAHEVLYWGGGHCGYTGTDVSHFSLKTLRWTGSFPGEFTPEVPPFYGPGVNMSRPIHSLGGRPWVPHADTTYGYDAAGRKAVMTGTTGPTGTFIYDPAKRDFVDRFDQPFGYGGASFPTMLCPTPHGMMCYQSINSYWKGAQKGLFKLDLAARKWTRIGPVGSKCRSSGNNRMVYDSKRDRLLIIDSTSRTLSAWSFRDGGGWKVLDCAGEVPASSLVRESAYLPAHDVILSCGGAWLCDLAKGNRWIATGIDIGRAGRNLAMTYDPALDVLVKLNGSSTAPVRLWLMRLRVGRMEGR